MEVGALEVALGIETAEFLSGLGNAQKAMLAFGEGVRELGAEAIEAASKAQNVASELRGLFGEQAEGIRKWAEAAGVALGRNATDIEKSVLGFARMAEPLVKNKELAAQMSEEMAAMAVNMAKAMHVSDDEALQKLEAGFRGSARAMREFGIDISNTALKQVALNAGFQGSTDHLNQAQLSYLRYIAITQQAADIQARANAASEDYSNVLVTLKSHWEGMLEGVGAMLLPLATTVIEVLDGLIRALMQLGQWVGVAFGLFSEQLATVDQATYLLKEAWDGTFSMMEDGLRFITDAFYHLAESIVSGLGAAFQFIQEHLHAFENIDIKAKVSGAIGGLEGGRASANASHASGLSGLKSTLEGAGKAIADVVKDQMATLGAFYGKQAAGAMPSSGPKFNTAKELSALASPHDKAGAGGKAAMAAQDEASAAWFAANTAMSATSKKEALVALQVASDEATAAAAASMIADEYAKAHKHSKLAAEAAEKAAQASDDATAALAQASQAYADRLQAEVDAERQMAEARQQAQQSMLASITPSGVTKVEQGAQQGAQAGGATGAVAGGLLAALQQTQAFQKLMTQVNGIIVQLMQPLQPLLDAIRPLVGVIGLIATTVAKALTPIFTLLAKLIQPLIQPLDLVAQLLNALTPVINVVVQVLTALNPAFALLNLAMQAVDAVLKVVGTIILGIMIGLGTVWNGIVEGVQGVINWFIDAINSVLGWLGVHINEVDFKGAEVNVQSFKDAIKQLWATTDATAQAQADNAAAAQQAAGQTGQFTQALGAATDALTNVPTGMATAIYQLQLSIANASPGGSIPHFAGGGRVTSPTLAVIGEGGEGESIIPDSKLGTLGGAGEGSGGDVNIQIVSNDPADIWDRLQPYFRRAGVRLNGIPQYNTTPRFAAG